MFPEPYIHDFGGIKEVWDRFWFFLDRLDKVLGRFWGRFGQVSGRLFGGFAGFGSVCWEGENAPPPWGVGIGCVGLGGFCIGFRGVGGRSGEISSRAVDFRKRWGAQGAPARPQNLNSKSKSDLEFDFDFHIDLLFF